MRKSVYKKTFTILIIIFISSCNPTKGIKYNQLLLDNNKVFVNDTVSNDINVLSLIKQNPNSKPIGLGIPLRLYIHHLSKNDTTKDFKKISVNKFLNDIGEKPVLVDSLKTINSLKDIQSYYFSKGWFNVGGKFKIKNKLPLSLQNQPIRIQQVRLQVRLMLLRRKARQKKSQKICKKSSS